MKMIDTLGSGKRFHVAKSSITREHRFNVKYIRFGGDHRLFSFTQRMIGIWNILMKAETPTTVNKY